MLVTKASTFAGTYCAATSADPLPAPPSDIDTFTPALCAALTNVGRVKSCPVPGVGGGVAGGFIVKVEPTTAAKAMFTCVMRAHGMTVAQLPSEAFHVGK